MAQEGVDAGARRRVRTPVLPASPSILQFLLSLQRQTLTHIFTHTHTRTRARTHPQH